MEVKWSTCYGDVSKERLSVLEVEMGIRFPVFFLKTINHCDGGVPIDGTFEYYDPIQNITIKSGVAGFLRLMPSKWGSILDDYLSPPEYFPEGLIAFADVGNGDLICFDYRDGKDNPNPPVVYWNHEADEGEDVSFVAKNFEEFMGMLREDDFDYDE